MGRKKQQRASTVSVSLTFLTSSKKQTNPKKQAGQPAPVRTATLRDLTPTDKAKVSRLLRRVLSLSADNERLCSSSSAAAAAREGEAAELRKRLDAALDSLAEARRRAEAAEARLRAAVGSCVCGACGPGAMTEVGGGGGCAREEGGEERGEENQENSGRSNSNAPPTTTTTSTSKGRRTLVFNESKGAFEFKASREEEEEEQEEPRRRAGASSGGGASAVASAFPPVFPPKQQQQQQRRGGERGEAKSLRALVADVEASLAAAALRR